MKKFFKYLFITIFILFICIACFFAYLYINYNVVVKSIAANNPSSNSFSIIGNILYGKYSIGDAEGIAVFDTGATITSVDLSNVNPKYYQHTGVKTIRAIFEDEQHALYKVTSFNALGRNLSSATVISTRSNGLNIIGCPEIFGSDSFLLSRKGVYFGEEINNQIAGVNKIPITAKRTIDRSGKTIAIYFKLDINGKAEQVLFDTGMPELLTATDKNIINDNKSIIPSFNLLRTANGINFNSAYSYDATITVADKKILTRYKAISNWAKPRARYYLGAEILNHYSILFDLKNYHYYFIPVEQINVKHN